MLVLRILEHPPAAPQLISQRYSVVMVLGLGPNLVIVLPNIKQRVSGFF